MNKKQNDKNKNNTLKLIIGLLIILVILIATFAIYMINNKNQDENKNIAYTDLIKEINEETVEKIEMTVGSTTAKVKLKNEEYKLFTYQELLNDERIMQVNSDIVGYIKEFNL